MTAQRRTGGTVTDETSATQSPADELSRLRAENEALKAQLDSGKSRPGRGRAWLAILLVVVGALILPIAVVTTWVRTDVLTTSGYVETVAPLAEDPAVQAAVADRIAEYVRDEIEIESAVAELLPANAQALAPVIASGAVEVVRTATLEFVKTRAFYELWREANQIGHAVALEALTGRDEGVVRTDSGQIYIPIGEMINQVAEQVGDRIGVDLVAQLPEDLSDARYVVTESQALADAQDLLEFVDRLGWLSVIISLACLIAGFFVAPSRSRGALWVGVGVVTAMVAMRLVYAWGRNVFRDGMSDSGADVDASTAFFDIITRFLTQSIRVVFVVGLVLLLLGWLSGPGERAAEARDWFNRLTGRASERFDEPGAVSRWIAAQRSVLRAIIVAFAIIVLFAWERPTAFVVLLVVALAALLVWVIALFSRVVAVAKAPESAEPSGHAPAEEAAAPAASTPDAEPATSAPAE
jgi:hypothetical protein